MKPKLISLNEHPSIEKNVIYAVNHSSTHDFPITCEAIRRHTYVLVAKQRLKPGCCKELGLREACQGKKGDVLLSVPQISHYP